MKNRKCYVTKALVEPTVMMQDVVGTKVLYNWLYQKEEENYYLSEKAFDFFPDISQEALFVEY